MKLTRFDCLKQNYRKAIELCMAITLVIHIILFQFVRFDEEHFTQAQIDKIKIEVVHIPKTWQQKKIRKPNRPPQPTVPIPMEEEYIPEDITIVPTKLDFSNILPPPPPPPSPLEEYDYENYSFVPYSKPPEIIGGVRRVRKQIRYPSIAKKVGLEGTTVVCFLIDKDGSIIKCYVLYSAGFEGFDEEALRVAKKIKFKPAEQRDQKVKIWLAMPFTFKLK